MEISRGGTGEYRDLFDEAPVAYHELDQEGTIRRVNQAECELLGLSADELIGRPVWEFVAGEEAEASRAAVIEKLMGKRPLVPFCRTYVTRESRYRTVEVRDRLIRNAEGKNVGIRSALIDITERVAAEQALTESRDWLEAVVRSSADAVITIDPLGQVVTLNPAAESLFNVLESEVAGAVFEEHLKIADIQIGEQYLRSLSSIFTHSLQLSWTGTAAVTPRERPALRALLSSSPLKTRAEHIMGIALTLCRHYCPLL
ncbi:MAG: PAS domain S-box protein, partial [Bryobacteraceae bacterium]